MRAFVVFVSFFFQFLSLFKHIYELCVGSFPGHLDKMFLYFHMSNSKDPSQMKPPTTGA